MYDDEKARDGVSKSYIERDRLIEREKEGERGRDIEREHWVSVRKGVAMCV